MHIYPNDQWLHLFERHKNHISPHTFYLVLEQYQSFKRNDCPTIADPKIIKIPIIECGEELIDVSKANHPRISVMNEEELILAHQCPEDIDPRSSGHIFVRKSVYKSFVRMLDELDRLSPLFEYEAGDLCIKVFEGLRDLETQKILFDKCLHSIMQKNSSLTYAQAYNQTCTWVSPYINNVPTHSTGAAVDFHVWSNKKQQFCSMGRFNVGNSSAPTFSDSLTEEQITNRFLLIIAATEAGLTNYVYEWWHYSHGDRYACYWQTASNAWYNSL